MGRSIIAVIAGVIIGAFLVLLVELLGHQLFPPPVNFDPADPAAIRALPFGAKISVLAAWFTGAFGGGAVASLIARRWAPAAWVVAATILLFAAVNFASFPHPLWMILGSLPATAFGGFLAIKATRAAYGRPPGVLATTP